MRVNVGCGATPTDGWANLDNSLSIRVARWPVVVGALSKARILDRQSREFAKVAVTKNIQFANASRRIPYADNSVEVVYSSHMIEHLDRREAHAFLLEVKRVLRPAGIVRIAAPDLAQLVKIYQATGDANQFIERTHMSQARARGLVGHIKMVLIGSRGHLWMYDGDSLAALLRSAGFTEVSIVPAGTTRIENPGSLDLAERSEESVYVEAVQPLV
jgi:predicted SAM-dependent methyltransferase